MERNAMYHRSDDYEWLQRISAIDMFEHLGLRMEYRCRAMHGPWHGHHLQCDHQFNELSDDRGMRMECGQKCVWRQGCRCQVLYG